MTHSAGRHRFDDLQLPEDALILLRDNNLLRDLDVAIARRGRQRGQCLIGRRQG